MLQEKSDRAYRGRIDFVNVTKTYREIFFSLHSQELDHGL